MTDAIRIPAGKRGVCSVCGTAVWKGRTSAAVQRCRPCRRADPAPRSVIKNPNGVEWDCGWCGKHCYRPPTKGQIPKYCSDKCQYSASSRGQEQYCPWCGSSYVPTYNAQKACSRRCGQWIRHCGPPSRCTDLILVPPEPTRWESRFEAQKADAPWWRVVVQGDCAWCGDSFTSLSTTGADRYCSKRCGKYAGRAARHRVKGRFAITAARRRRLYERDGWTCQICGDSTSRQWSHDDPWSPTLDHIEPRSATLIPDDSDDNLRTAHWVCNTLRGASIRADDEVRLLTLSAR